MKNKLECCMCHRTITDGVGNSPIPVYTKHHGSGRVCNDCNRLIVVPTLNAFAEGKKPELDTKSISKYMSYIDRNKVYDQIWHKGKTLKAPKVIKPVEQPKPITKPVTKTTKTTHTTKVQLTLEQLILIEYLMVLEQLTGVEYGMQLDSRGVPTGVIAVRI